MVSYSTQSFTLYSLAWDAFEGSLTGCFVTGGETIKQINQQTGAHCELDRRPPANPAEKTFVIRGTPEQIESCKRVIAEKLGMVSLNIVRNHSFKVLTSQTCHF